MAGGAPPLQKAIGGVFGLASTGPDARGQGLVDVWARGAAACHLFHNARSAVAYILRTLGPGRLWLPAYLCPDLVEGAQESGPEIRYFPVGDRLVADCDVLEPALRSGDVVVAIRYFGRPVGERLRDLAARRQDVVFIEDAAQSLDYGGFADFRVYSPRKLVGVPDGGVLVDVPGRLPVPSLTAPDNDLFERPCRMRSADPDGFDNEAWFPVFQQAEAEMEVRSWAMSNTARDALSGVDVGFVAARRRSNYAQLHEGLGDLALFAESTPGWTPLCFPVRCDGAAGLWRRLIACRIFPARHWRGLLSPRAFFPAEHALSEQIISLPCDQRYGPEDMARVIRVIREAQA